MGWPELLDHPFVRETVEERVRRERAMAEALEIADSSRAWRVSIIICQCRIRPVHNDIACNITRLKYVQHVRRESAMAEALEIADGSRAWRVSM